MPEPTSPAFLSGGGEVGAAIRAHDWAATPIGRPETWPDSLKTLVGVMIVSRQPMFIAWGPGRTLLFNQPYTGVLGGKHPGALGRDFLEVWSEIRADLLPLIDTVNRGESVHMDDITLVMQRFGRPEETHFAFSYTPVLDAGGAIAGLFCACSETTEQVFAERRQAFRIALDEQLRHRTEQHDIVSATTRLIGEALGAGRVGFGDVSPSGDTAHLRTFFHDGMDPFDAEFRLDAFGPGLIDAQRRGQTLAFEDIHAVPEADRATWDRIGARAVLSIPLMREGRFSAVLFVNCPAPRAWNRHEVALLGQAASRMNEALDRAAAEEALRQSEAHLAGIFAQTGAGFAEADTEGRFLSVNDHYCAMLGYRRDELLRMRIADITHADDRDAAAALRQEVLETGEARTIELRYRRGDGATVWVADTVSLITAASHVRTLLAVAIDVTARKQIEADLGAARDAAEQANLAKSTFIANMSHELRTPLSAIIGYSEMLQEEIADGADPAEFQTDMGKIESNARHLLGLINDVLDLSKIESGKMEVFAEAIDIAPLLRDIAGTVGTLVARKGNRLVLEVPPELGTMRSDVTKLRQTILNLLSNAAKFTENGTITLSARREPGPHGAQPAGERILFSVRDSGIGMTEEQQAKLFQRFSQADSSTTRRFGGTGLGLSITKAFMTMLDGRIGVHSVPGEGSTFTVDLPADLPEPDRAPPDEPARTEAEPTADLGAHRETVLVIDDDPAQLELMSRFLEREGFQPRTAIDGPTGLLMARRLRPRAILLDVTMPAMDGWAVLRVLKEDPDLAEIPVVMVTFINDSGLAAALGAADHVTKPVRWEEFRTIMDQFRTHDGDILLVDDHEDARRHMRTALERDGWSVTEAVNGQDALAKVAQATFKVVLLDLEMPVMDGFAFLRAFRAHPNGRDTPVVVITARDLTREVRQNLRDAQRLLNKADTTYRNLTREILSVTQEAAPPPP